MIDDSSRLKNFLDEFARLKGEKILVHGGGKRASEISLKMGLQPKLVNGRRITDAASLEVVQMVYGGLINKNIVARLQANGCPALGLSGADADLIRAEKRPPRDIDYGFAGDIRRTNGQRIKQLLACGLTPVFCALTHDGQGQMLNTNADTIASAVAAELAGDYSVRLVYCFEKAGVLRDLKDEHTLISVITQRDYRNLCRQGIIASGMLPKLDTAFAAAGRGVKEVLIIRDNQLGLVNKDRPAGTKIVMEENGNDDTE